MSCKYCGSELPVPAPLNETCPYSHSILLALKTQPCSASTVSPKKQVVSNVTDNSFDSRSTESTISCRPDYVILNGHVLKAFAEIIQEGGSTRSKREHLTILMDFVEKFCNVRGLDNGTCLLISRELEKRGFDTFNKFQLMRPERISTYFPEEFLQEAIESMRRFDWETIGDQDENVEILDFVFTKDSNMLLEPYFNKLREELQGGRVCAAYKNLVDFIAFCMMSQNKCWNFDSPHYKIVIMEVNKWGGNIPLLPKPISEKYCRTDVSVKINNTKAQLKEKTMDLNDYLEEIFEKKRPNKFRIVTAEGACEPAISDVNTDELETMTPVMNCRSLSASSGACSQSTIVDDVDDEWHNVTPSNRARFVDTPARNPKRMKFSSVNKVPRKGKKPN